MGSGSRIVLTFFLYIAVDLRKGPNVYAELVADFEDSSAWPARFE